MTHDFKRYYNSGELLQVNTGVIRFLWLLVCIALAAQHLRLSLSARLLRFTDLIQMIWLIRSMSFLAENAQDAQ